jgi:7-cyano-7-deazaguanine synthase in queuosine biosynthesis
MKNVEFTTDIVCMMSGGIDSSLAATLILEETKCNIWPLYIRRGASAEQFELNSLNEILIWLKSKYPNRINELKIISCHYPPPEIKLEYPKNIQNKYGYIGREIIMSHTAIFYGLTIGIDPKYLAISTGSLNDDLFPHNSRGFWKLVNELIKIELCEYAFEIINPLQGDSSRGVLNKKMAVALAFELKIPVELTRSCVSSSKDPCGICLECCQRNDALREFHHV